MITIKELKKKQNIINEKVMLLKDNVTGATAKVDGIVDIEEYLNASLRIMWVLKEVNSPNDDGDWNMIDELTRWSKDLIPSDFRKTFDNILYTTNGILTETQWENQPDQDGKDGAAITRQLLKIAYCNVKKVPGSSSTNMNALRTYYQNSDKHIVQQINEFEPQVMIFGGTYDILEPDLDVAHFSDGGDHRLGIYTTSKQIILNAYHPQNRSMTREDYCNSIINAVLDWKKNSRSHD